MSCCFVLSLFNAFGYISYIYIDWNVLTRTFVHVQENVLGLLFSCQPPNENLRASAAAASVLPKIFQWPKILFYPWINHQDKPNGFKIIVLIPVD